jgi:hypothetical protein
LNTFYLELSENGDEYTGYITIEADTCEQVDDKTICVNGATIIFDERIVIR